MFMSDVARSLLSHVVWSYIAELRAELSVWGLLQLRFLLLEGRGLCVCVCVCVCVCDVCSSWFAVFC